MQEKFRNKYRVESTRLQNWNYGWQAAYFITICTKGRKSFFGDVINGKMELNEIGNIAKNEWLKTFEMRPDMNLLMGEFMIMPNHFHSIIIIGKNQYNSNSPTAAMHCGPNNTDAMHCDNSNAMQCGPGRTDAMHCVSTNIPGHIPKNEFGPQSKNLGSIIRGFKIGVTTRARIINSSFAWQPLYHDHIIRDQRSFERISEYIKNNPKKWTGENG
ncbi:MAG: hypothetical protein ABJ092_01260 [Gillisia sp.]